MTRKGYKHTLEAREKMRRHNLAHPRRPWLGKERSIETKMKISRANKGRATRGRGWHMAPETKLKISLAKIGKKASEETREILRKSHLGIKMPPFSAEHRRNIGKVRKGEKCHFWRGGIFGANAIARRSIEYKLWRESVFARDNYTCVWCNLKGGWNRNLKKRVMLNADHIKPFCDYPELRLSIDNGRTLCLPCHRKTDTWGKNSAKDHSDLPDSEPNKYD